MSFSMEFSVNVENTLSDQLQPLPSQSPAMGSVQCALSFNTLAEIILVSKFLSAAEVQNPLPTAYVVLAATCISFRFD